MTDIDAVALSPEEEAAIRRVVPEWQASAAVAPEREFVHIIAALMVTLDAARADRDGLREAAGLPQFPATDASAALIRSAIQSGSGTSPSFDDTLALALRDFDAIWNWCRAALTAEAGPR